MQLNLAVRNGEGGGESGEEDWMLDRSVETRTGYCVRVDWNY